MKISVNDLASQSYDARPGVAVRDACAGRSSKAKRLKSELCADRAKHSAGRQDSVGAGRVAPLGISQIMQPLSISFRGKARKIKEKRRVRYVRRKRSGKILRNLYTDKYTFEEIREGKLRTLVYRSSGEIFSERFVESPLDEIRLPRPSTCGWAMGQTADIGMHSDGSAHWQNVEHCGSIHACPHCASIIRAERSEEIRQAVETHQANGGSLLFLTLTIRHNHSDSLDTTLNAVLEGWRKLINGSPYARWKKRLNISGYIRSLEVTISKANLWHPHVHALLFLENEISDTELNAFTDWLYARWEKKVVSLGAQKPTREHGIKMLRVDNQGRALSKYLAKVQEEEETSKSTWHVSAEIGRSDVKSGRGESLVPFQLLDDCDDFSSEQCFHLWREYYLVTKNRRAITWSRGLKDRFEINEKTDEEIVEETEGGEVVFSTDSREYMRLLNSSPEILALVLEYAEMGRIDMISRFLTPVNLPGKPGTDSVPPPPRE